MDSYIDALTRDEAMEILVVEACVDERLGEEAEMQGIANRMTRQAQGWLQS